MVSPSGTVSSVRGASAHRGNGRSSPMRARAQRLCLLGQFSLLSLMLIAALGAVLATVLEGQIERRALEGAEQLALVTARVGVAPHLTSRDLLRPMSPLRLSQLDTDLRQTGLEEVGLVRVKIYNSHAALVYSDDRRLIGESELESGKLREALGGGLASDVENGTEDTHSGRRVLEVYTPLRLAAGGLAPGRRRDGGRGAGALAASGARPAPAGPVRPARGAHRHDRPPDPVGARRRPAPVRRVARAASGADRGGQPGGG